jgi:hypothetical protein
MPRQARRPRSGAQYRRLGRADLPPPSNSKVRAALKLLSFHPKISIAFSPYIPSSPDPFPGDLQFRVRRSQDLIPDLSSNLGDPRSRMVRSVVGSIVEPRHAGRSATSARCWSARSQARRPACASRVPTVRDVGQVAKLAAARNAPPCMTVPRARCLASGCAASFTTAPA